MFSPFCFISMGAFVSILVFIFRLLHWGQTQQWGKEKGKYCSQAAVDVAGAKGEKRKEKKRKHLDEDLIWVFFVSKV